MDRQLSDPRTFELAVVIEPTASDIPGFDKLTFLHSDGWLDAYSSSPYVDATGRHIQKAVATLQPAIVGGKDSFLALHVEPAPSLDVFDLIPDDFGQSAGIVMQCRDVVDCIVNPLLRKLLSDVFSIPIVYRGFWTAPVANAGPIRSVGGLAYDSMLMADRVLARQGLIEDIRDMGIVYAILHDIRWVWLAEYGTNESSRENHSRNIMTIQGPLDRFTAESPELAHTLRQLLGRSWTRGDYVLTKGAQELARRASLLRSSSSSRSRPSKYIPVPEVGDDTWSV